MLKNRLTSLLATEDITFELIHHEPDYSALETAHDTHTPGIAFAKSVVLNTDDGPVLAVLPAPCLVDLGEFAREIGEEEVTLADERTISELFPDCAIGAEPPFGHLYGMPVYIDAALCVQDDITFNAGSHDEAMRIRYVDYERLEQPTRGHFATPR